MTFIASYQRDTETVMVGDLMLSRDGNRHTPALPSRFDGGLPVENPLLCGLSQKIVLVTDRLAVAWCDSYDVAEKIISLIKTHASTLATMEAVLDLVESSGQDLSRIHLIIYLMKMDGETCNLSIGGYRIRQTVWEPRHKVMYEGSGTDHFLKTIEFNVFKQTGAINSFEDTIATWLTRATIAFFKEMTSHELHHRRYGGGFELLIPSFPGCRYVKVPYSTFFWSFSGSTYKRMNIAYSMQYTPDKQLSIDRFTTDDQGKPILTRFPVDNVLLSEPPKHPPPVGIENMFCIHHFLPEDPADPRRKILIKKGSDHALKPKLLDDDGAITVEISAEGAEEIATLIFPG